MTENYTSNDIVKLFNNLKENEGLKITFEIPSYMSKTTSVPKKDIDLGFAGLLNARRPIDILEVTAKQHGVYRISTRAIIDVTVLDEPNFILVNTSALGD